MPTDVSWKMARGSLVGPLVPADTPALLNFTALSLGQAQAPQTLTAYRRSAQGTISAKGPLCGSAAAKTLGHLPRLCTCRRWGAQ